MSDPLDSLKDQILSTNKSVGPKAVLVNLGLNAALSVGV